MSQPSTTSETIRTPIGIHRKDGGVAGRRSRAIRVRAGRAETAVWTLVHHPTGRVATLVGVMHIGDSAYFESLSGLLAQLAACGAQLHVEGISRRAVDELDMTPWERDRLAESKTWTDPETTGTAVEVLQLDSQGQRLRLPKEARNVDLSDLELLRAVGWEAYRRLLGPAPDQALAPHMGMVVRTVIRLQLRHGRTIECLRRLRARNRRVETVVIDSRNRRAFEGALDALQDGDVALVWGTDHLPGLASLFRASGYQLVHEEWFEACRI